MICTYSSNACISLKYKGKEVGFKYIWLQLPD